MAPGSVLVTGGAGYIGSALLRQLTRADSGPRVRVLDNLQRDGYAALMGLGPRGPEFIEGDLLDPRAVRRALEGVEAVVHLAGAVSTPLSFEHPRWTEQVNHWGTARLVEAALEAGVERFIFTSSYSVYGPGESADERTICRPVGPYAVSKLGAERAVTGGSQRGLVTTVLRLGVVYGTAPVTRFDALPNRLAYLAGTGRTLPVHGDGEQRRPFLHVEDASSAITFCLERPEETAGAVFNVLGANASVLEVVDAVQAARHGTAMQLTEQNVRTHLTFSMSGARFAELGWRPSRVLEEGVGELVDRFAGVTTPEFSEIN